MTDSDVEWKENITAEQLKREGIIDKVNSECSSVKIIDCFNVDPSVYVKNTDWYSWLGEIEGHSMSMVQERMMVWDGTSWVFGAKRRSGPEIIKEVVPGLKNRVLFVQSNGKILCGITAHGDLNPYFVVGGIFGDSYKTAMKYTLMSCVGFYRDLDISCKCGNNATFDLLRNRNMSICPVCQQKGLLKKLVG